MSDSSEMAKPISQDLLNTERKSRKRGERSERSERSEGEQLSSVSEEMKGSDGEEQRARPLSPPPLSEA